MPSGMLQILDYIWNIVLLHAEELLYALIMFLKE